MNFVLENENDFEVVGHPADGREAVRLAAELSPDVVLMDITMPNMDGIEATACIVKSHPDIRIVGLSMHEDGGMKERMIKAGAAAYVSRRPPRKRSKRRYSPAWRLKEMFRFQIGRANLPESTRFRPMPRNGPNTSTILKSEDYDF